MSLLITKKLSAKSGFTLIELLVVIGIIAILSAVVITAVTPARQFAAARNTQRTANVRAILDAIGQNMADNRGVWTCAAGALPSTPTNMVSAGGYDIAPCLVDTYLSQMPFDPAPAPILKFWTSTSSYNTGYSVYRESGSSGRVVVSAPAAEDGEVISVTR